MTTAQRQPRISLKLPKEVSLPFITIQLLVALSVLGATIGYFVIQPEIPLLYSLARPEQQILPKEYIFLIPGVALAFGLIDSMIILSLKKYDVLLLKLFSWITVVFIALLNFALFRILYIVT